MNKIKFKQVCESVIFAQRARRIQGGIGTLGEKTVHAVLKQYYEPDLDRHERKIGSFVADIVSDEGIIEIQTRGFDKLRKKLAQFLECCLVTLVYPVPRTKWLLWVDPQTGEATKKRKSPKTGRVCDAVFELYKIKSQLDHPNLRICLVFLDLEEYRYLDGWGREGKKGSTRCDRVPVELVEEIWLNNTADYIKFVPGELGGEFTSKDFKTAARVNLRTAQLALNILNHLGVVERVGKQGNGYVYRRNGFGERV